MRSLLQALQVGAEFAMREGPCVARFFMPSPPMIVAQRASDAAPPPPAAAAAGALPPAPTTDLSAVLARVSAAVEGKVGLEGAGGSVCQAVRLAPRDLPFLLLLLLLQAAAVSALSAKVDARDGAAAAVVGHAAPR